MLDLDDIRESVRHFNEKSPLGFKLTLILILLFIISLFVLLFQSTVDTVVLDSDENFVPDQPILLPDNPNVEVDNFESRITEPNWTETEILNYYKEPDSKNIKNLEEQNERIVNDEILGSAP